MRGVRAEWQNLPRRKCDNCGENYQPKRPMRTGERGFCKDNCRKEYHKHGGSFSKLKPLIRKEVQQRVREASPADVARIEALENRIGRLEDLATRLRDACYFCEPVK